TSKSRTSSKQNHRIKKSSATVRNSASCKVSRKSSSLGFLKSALVAVICMMILIGSYMAIETVCFSPEVNAEECLSELKYKVVEIQYGDTLWSIAKENMNPGFYDINEYIAEIKECNQLCSDQITRGCSLLIPYYESTAITKASIQ
ncbi:MAG: LysM peptidoglycan-binding domain-containing protein, partial [Eubacteriales bacterium]|nr:LysM peptidoglycan-binding domain-containing protein [Eubacteriales bacterium]